MAASYSILDIAQLINATVLGDDQSQITALAPIATAGAGDLTFLLPAYRRFLADTKATAVILTEEDAQAAPCISLVVNNPELAFSTIAALFDTAVKPPAGIHPSAVISPSAIIAESASVGAHCVIGDNVTIGEHTILGARVVVDNNSSLGKHCLLHSGATVMHGVTIGDHVILHPGSVIGGDGFGLAKSAHGWEKIPQIGGVVLHDYVEVGVNSCVDRGALESTCVNMGVKIDNLVQIAHNVVIGEHTVIAGCVAIAGSTSIGKHCIVGGTTGIAGHLTICDGVIFTGGAMVTKSVTTPGLYSSGTGLYPNTAWRKMAVRLRQLDAFMKKNKMK